jgi:ribosomal protein S18 acetylase RimI-like enzyme
MTYRISLGLPANLRREAAVIYWQAFGAKLGRVLGPEPKALVFLERALRAEFCMAATSEDGQLLGMAGFKTRRGSFAGGTSQDMRAVYGRIGAAWRLALLWLLERDTEKRRFLLDGICVTTEARGQGVGSALLDAICAEALSRGYSAVRLDVVDTNPRARALYERMGFQAVDTVRIGALRHVFGFAAAVTMVKPIR